MMPTTIIQLLGFLGAVGAALFGGLQGWKWYLNTLEEKEKSKKEIEVAKYNAQVAKEHSEILTASQVMELIKATQDVKEDIAQIKADNEDRNEELTRALFKLENNLKNFEDTFQKFLIARLNQFEQALIK